MKYGVRVGIGIALGAAFAVGLTLWLGQWWIGALAGGLAGPVAFLATFFVWSADRPEDGYEQVLFDRPNAVLSGVMVLAFVGLAFGAGLALGPSVSPAESAALTQMDASRETLGGLSAAIAAANAALAKSETAADPAEQLAMARQVRADLAALEPPESLFGHKDPLYRAANAAETAFDAQEKCMQGDAAACLDLRIAHSDVLRGLQTYDQRRASL